MSISTFDLFKIGIGPSSSHTVGPMIAARRFATGLDDSGLVDACARVTADLYGSLGATGAGHGSPKAIILGLEGESPEAVDVDTIAARVAKTREEGALHLLGRKSLAFSYRDDLLMHRNESLPFHSNGMRFTAYDEEGAVLSQRIFYSVGGGFIVDETASGGDAIVDDPTQLPYPFSSGDELLSLCKASGLSISTLMMENEKSWRTEQEIREGLLQLWQAMSACISRGCETEGILPGGLKVKRRAAQLHRQLKSETDSFGDE